MLFKTNDTCHVLQTVLIIGHNRKRKNNDLQNTTHKTKD